MSGERKSISPSGWKAPSGYAHGVSAEGRVIVMAGQIGWNPRTGQFESDDFADQTAQALRNIAEILTSAGARPENIVRLTWFITSREEYTKARKAIGSAYKEIFGRYYPAMSVIVVSALLEPRAKVEIEATAVVPA
jgi:enamine deaminase RidA (YjgF/YER057c/UK114 family)